MKRLVFVVNRLEYFLSHRLGLAKSAVKAGYDVIVLCPLGQRCDVEGITFKHWQVSRSGTNPWQEWRSIAHLGALLRELKPDLVHAITIKPVIYTGFLRRLGFFRMPWVATVPGMGYVFSGQDWKRRVLQWVVGLSYRWALKANHVAVIFQNRDDRAFFEAKHWIHRSQAKLILGSGVCPKTYLPQHPSDGPVVVILPARLLKDKGIVEWVKAIQHIKSKVSARFALVGACDPDNLASLSQDEIDHWVDQGWVEHWGWQDDMISQFAKAHIVCLPSYREGLPKVLIEAASCEKAIITTDVPGCREIVAHEVTGLLVAARKIEPLCQALLRLIEDAPLRLRLGQAARQRVIDALSLDAINQQTLDVYKERLTF